MFPPKRILFPVDFSERSSAVVPTVEAFARKFESEVTLLHVENPIPVEGASSPETVLEALASRPEFSGVNVRTRIAIGDPASEIIQFAHDQMTDLIVIPTHGYGPFRRFLVGSVTLKVLHDAWCPVWTDAHTEALPPEQPRFRSIVCALDLTPKSHATLQWVWQFAKVHDAKVVLVHAIPLLASYGAEYVQPELQQQIADAATRQLDCLQRSEKTFAPVEIMTGDVADAVRIAVEAENADLLVIGRSVDDRLLGRLRTHAYSIIRHSPCGVVSI
jgi:nucleotide-binding universal stress UspA family protein